MKGDTMPEYITYLPLTGVLPTDLKAGTSLLVQVFLDDITGKLISAQFATRGDTWETWGVPAALGNA